ncbi:hypothetical protein TNIN_207051 [Trichonephila inaurata madagascariensis]|uniref:Uncharacterized protein n=1 Tax=Trichonephila inaurata madagascariensis TaxID=2747483 RepID=A0A8X6XNC0_9ARAC|nr:hypothetical protein TNIN_207051 [Trichonephila inaurata madagascariensis]
MKSLPRRNGGIKEAFHDEFSSRETQLLAALPKEGNGLCCDGAHQLHFITYGKWVGKPTGGSFTKPASTWSPQCQQEGNPLPTLRQCRKCGHWDGNTPARHKPLQILLCGMAVEHNAVPRARIGLRLHSGAGLSENQVVGPNRLRPDLVAQIDSATYISSTSHFRSRTEDEPSTRTERKEMFKYLGSYFYFYISPDSNRCTLCRHWPVGSLGLGTRRRFSSEGCDKQVRQLLHRFTPVHSGTTFKLFELWAFPERPIALGRNSNNAMAVGTPTVKSSVDTAIVETVFVSSTICPSHRCGGLNYNGLCETVFPPTSAVCLNASVESS